MVAGSRRWKALAACAVLCWSAGTAVAQTAAYKCRVRGVVTYGEVPCAGNRPVGQRVPHATDKWKSPPQDRALVARRARLSPQDRQECSVLDGRLREQQRFVHDKGEAATLQDEMPLVQSKKRFRELHC